MKGKSKRSTQWDEGFVQGVLSALSVVTTLGYPQVWQDIVAYCGDPLELRQIAQRDDLLESCGFNDHQTEFDQVIERKALQRQVAVSQRGIA